MDSQTQLAEYNDGVSIPAEETVENIAETDAETGSNLEPLTDQAIADSIQASLQDDSIPSTIEPIKPIEPTIGRYSDFSARLVNFWQEFSQSSQPFLVSLAWVLGALVALRILAAIVNAVNGIPLLAPLFQLIGAGYTVWFINRYLLKHSTRQELSQKVKSFTGQTLGRPSSSDSAISLTNSDLSRSSELTVSDPAMLEE